MFNHAMYELNHSFRLIIGNPLYNVNGCYFIRRNE